MNEDVADGDSGDPAANLLGPLISVSRESWIYKNEREKNREIFATEEIWWTVGEISNIVLSNSTIDAFIIAAVACGHIRFPGLSRLT